MAPRGKIPCSVEDFAAASRFLKAAAEKLDSLIEKMKKAKTESFDHEGKTLFSTAPSVFDWSDAALAAFERATEKKKIDPRS